MHLLGRAQSASKVAPRESKACVSDQVCLKAEVARHTDRSLHGVVGTDSGYNEHVIPGLPQPALEVSANKRAVGPLGNDRFTRSWRNLVLELIPGLAGPIGGGRKR